MKSELLGLRSGVVEVSVLRRGFPSLCAWRLETTTLSRNVGHRWRRSTFHNTENLKI